MEREVVLKIKKLREGQEIAIYPYSMDYGDPMNAIALPCPGIVPDLPMELRDPFKATFLSYSGNVLMVRTKEHACILIDLIFIRDIDAIAMT